MAARRYKARVDEQILLYPLEQFILTQVFIRHSSTSLGGEEVMTNGAILTR